MLFIDARYICFWGVFLLYKWDSKENRGFSFGYYGEFNTISNALKALPDVNITGSCYNDDVTLEEMLFTLRIGGEREIRIRIGETDSLRAMSGESLSSALRERIEKELSNSQSLEQIL